MKKRTLIGTTCLSTTVPLSGVVSSRRTDDLLRRACCNLLYESKKGVVVPTVPFVEEVRSSLLEVTC